MRSLLILLLLAGPALAQNAPDFDPKVLLELGRVERKLGHAREAISYYQRYLAANPQLDDASRLVVLKEIAELQPVVAAEEQPRLNLAAPPVHYEIHHDRGLIAGGVTLLGTAYAGAIITGSIILDENDRNAMNGYTPSSDTTPNSAAAGTLLIPVLGPLVSAFCYLHPSWSLPWLLVDGAAQVGGLAMIITGAKIKKKVPVLDRINFMPYGSADGGGMRISGRF